LLALERHAIVSGLFLTSTSPCRSLSRVSFLISARVAGSLPQVFALLVSLKLTTFGSRLSSPLK
jgi:hypothetical protein